MDSFLHRDFLCNQKNKDSSLSVVAHHLLESSQSPLSPDIGATNIFRSDDTLVVLNKIDLLESACNSSCFDVKCEGAKVCTISCKTGGGIDQFMIHLKNMLKKMYVNTVFINLIVFQLVTV